jgi:hypothetical protein
LAGILPVAMLGARACAQAKECSARKFKTPIIRLLIPLPTIPLPSNRGDPLKNSSVSFGKVLGRDSSGCNAWSAGLCPGKGMFGKGIQTPIIRLLIPLPTIPLPTIPLPSNRGGPFEKFISILWKGLGPGFFRLQCLECRRANRPLLKNAA